MIDCSHLQAADDALIAHRTLLNRVDTKFVTSISELPSLLKTIHPDDYRVVQHEDSEELHYESLYFDTSSRSLLRDHHRGRRPRFKLRTRHHLSRGVSFSEIKEKRPSGVTTKERASVPFGTNQLDAQHEQIFRGQAPSIQGPLEPAMRIGFTRTMLMGIHTPERISIDTQIWFDDSQSRAELATSVIIEVKQARFLARSPIMRQLRHHNALQLRVSKYITGSQLLWPHIRLNRYRDRLRMLRRRTVQ